MALKDWFAACVHLLFPKVCVVCSLPLSAQEECVCHRCNIDLPRTNLHLKPDNAVERMFWGKTELQRATSYFYYQRGSDYREILHQLKYRGRKEVGVSMGKQMAAELQKDGFFDDIAYLIPIPLHRKKQRIRGYNQSACLAEGISRVTGIPVIEKAITRQRHTETQTRKSAFDRWTNVEGIFKLHSTELFANKHILLIDDVLTTGATCVACADALVEVDNVRLSVLTLAMAE